jgi:catechol 2,3-dioxygenase-like lactoylglutathione lyase family enzyme
MVGYVTIGTNDLGRAAEFYDALLAPLGGQRAMELERFIVWAAGGGGPGMLAIALPFDEKPATVGNGVMVALAAGSTDMVDKLYAKALELGATDEGAPGPRGGGFYAGYFRDLDGNKLNAYHIG